jgi:hypothetical protein
MFGGMHMARAAPKRIRRTSTSPTDFPGRGFKQAGQRRCKRVRWNEDRCMVWVLMTAFRKSYPPER